jgi:hypothetical protein
MAGIGCGSWLVLESYGIISKGAESRVDKGGMIDFSTPLSGMRQAETSVNQIATRLANPATDTIDLSTEMVSMMSARDSFAVDAKLVETEDQMSQSAWSILA